MGYYSTEDEMQYLRTIGEHKKNGPKSVESFHSRLMPRQQVKHKINLLNNYIKTAEKREDWGSIEKKDRARLRPQRTGAPDGKRRSKDMKHTPGPWGVTQFTDVIYVTRQDSIPVNGGMIATITSQLDGVNNDEKLKETYANARLIAAAPDLLDALQKISKELRTSNDRMKMIETIETLTNAAIAKAEGGT